MLKLLFISSLLLLDVASASEYQMQSEKIHSIFQKPSKSIQDFIHLSEADPDLQQNETTCLQQCMDEFIKKSGTLIRLEENDDLEKFHIIEGDAIYPACSGGNCRSQTLWVLFRDFNDKIVLFPPHATRYGFDPYNNKVNWHRTYIVAPPEDEYTLWTGTPKPTKFGFDVFAEFNDIEDMPEEELKVLSDYYSQNYYGSESSWNGRKGKRRIYFSFAKNTHAILYRLNQTNDTLENVIVAHIPMEDLISHPLPEWDTYPLSVTAYTQLSQILHNFFDFSNLNN